MSEPASSPLSTASQPTVSADTVEHIVRTRLSAALGGRRDLVEGAIPTIGFTLTFVLTHHLRASLTVGIGLAVVLLVARLVQRQPVQFVVNSLIGIGIAAVFASRSGRAEDVFVPGIIYNAFYAVALGTSPTSTWRCRG